ncbi:MAG: response regulator [Sphingobacteriales bacterium]|nr:MAG: response regulator [Sphingobacteriales bacterium]
MTFSSACDLLAFVPHVDPAALCMIVVDQHMPLKNGIDCLRELSNMQDLKHVRLCVFSTFSLSTYSGNVRDLNALYIQKPSSYQETIAIIRDLATACLSKD